MRKISASYIFTGKEKLLKNGVLLLDDEGYVVEVQDTKGNLREIPMLEYYNGIICPGFINAHCHLELSYMRGMLQKTENTVGFIKQMLQKRGSLNGNIIEEIARADKEMQLNGIVACGDICNTEDSFITKAKSRIIYYNFIEVLGLKDNEAKIKIEKAKQLAISAISSDAGPASIAPHASYSVSLSLYNEIKLIAECNNSIISFHNQESLEEDALFGNKKNELYKYLEIFGLNKNTFPKTNKSSFGSIAQYLPKKNNILFIHNVFTKKEDVELAQKLFPKHFWIFCPKSNLHISNCLPDINIFKDENRICLGTDSLASNNTLSILEEMKLLQANFPLLSIETLLQWGTLNGAKALQIAHIFGSFETGKKPGVNLIYNLDLQQLKFNRKTKVRIIASC